MRTCLEGLIKRLGRVSTVPERELWWIASSITRKTEHQLKHEWMRNAKNAEMTNKSVTPHPIDLRAVGALNTAGDGQNAFTPSTNTLYTTRLDEIMSREQADRLIDMVMKRSQDRKPLQYLLGDVDFAGVTLKVRPPTLIPRPETEQMCAYLISHLKSLDAESASRPFNDNHMMDTHHSISQVMRDFPLSSAESKIPTFPFRAAWYDAFNPLADQMRMQGVQKTQQAQQQPSCINVLDLCSGSGAISLALAAAFPKTDTDSSTYVNAVGIELQESALSLSRENADLIQTQQMDEKKRLCVEFKAGDLFDPLDSIANVACQGQSGQFDLLVSNPPYIPNHMYDELQEEVRLWEDKAALCPPSTGVPINTTALSEHFPEVDDLLKDVDRHGLAFYVRIAELFPHLVKMKRPASNNPILPRGWNRGGFIPKLALEMGHSEQVQPIAKLIRAVGLRPALFLDTSEQPRWLVGYHSGTLT